MPQGGVKYQGYQLMQKEGRKNMCPPTMNQFTFKPETLWA